MNGRKRPSPARSSSPCWRCSSPLKRHRRRGGSRPARRAGAQRRQVEAGRQREEARRADGGGDPRAGAAQTPGAGQLRGRPRDRQAGGRLARRQQRRASRATACDGGRKVDLGRLRRRRRRRSRFDSRPVSDAAWGIYLRRNAGRRQRSRRDPLCRVHRARRPPRGDLDRRRYGGHRRGPAGPDSTGTPPACAPRRCSAAERPVTGPSRFARRHGSGLAGTGGRAHGGDAGDARRPCYVSDAYARGPGRRRRRGPTPPRALPARTRARVRSPIRIAPARAKVSTPLRGPASCSAATGRRRSCVAGRRRRPAARRPRRVARHEYGHHVAVEPARIAPWRAVDVGDRSAGRASQRICSRAPRPAPPTPGDEGDHDPAQPRRGLRRDLPRPRRAGRPAQSLVDLGPRRLAASCPERRRTPRGREQDVDGALDSPPADDAPARLASAPAGTRRWLAPVHGAARRRADSRAAASGGRLTRRAAPRGRVLSRGLWAGTSTRRLSFVVAASGSSLCA